MAKKREPIPVRMAMAVDLDGRMLPYTVTEVNKLQVAAAEHGNLIAAVFEKDGDVYVNVFGPPSLELVELLERATAGYRNVLKGQ